MDHLEAYRASLPSDIREELDRIAPQYQAHGLNAYAYWQLWSGEQELELPAGTPPRTLTSPQQILDMALRIINKHAPKPARSEQLAELRERRQVWSQAYAKAVGEWKAAVRTRDQLIIEWDNYVRAMHQRAMDLRAQKPKL